MRPGADVLTADDLDVAGKQVVLYNPITQQMEAGGQPLVSGAGEPPAPSAPGWYQVTNRTSWPSQNVSGQIVAPIWLRVFYDVDAIRFIYAGAQSYQENSIGGGSYGVEIGIENADGSLTLGRTSSSGTRATIAAGTVGHAQYLEITGPFKSGQEIKVWQSANGTNIAMTKSGLAAEFVHQDTSSPTGTTKMLSVMSDATRNALTGTMDRTAWAFRPVAVIGYHQGVAVFGLGDSTCTPGDVDRTDEAFSVAGVIERCVGRRYPVLNVSGSNEALARWAADTSNALRSSLAVYCNTGFQALNRNDQNNTIETNTANLAAVLAKGYFAHFRSWFASTAAAGNNTSSDQFTTYAGQTLDSRYATKIKPFNDLISARQGSSFVKVFDVEHVYSPRDQAGKTYIPSFAATVPLAAVASGNAYLLAQDATLDAFRPEHDGQIVIIGGITGATDGYSGNLFIAVMKYRSPTRVDLYSTSTGASKTLPGAVTAGMNARCAASWALNTYQATGSVSIHESRAIARWINVEAPASESAGLTTAIGLPGKFPGW